MRTILLQLSTHVATRSVSSLALQFPRHTHHVAFAVLAVVYDSDLLPLVALLQLLAAGRFASARDGWQTYALSATSGTTTWCNALRSLSLTPSSAPASTKGSKAFYAWKLLIAHLLITVWRNCYVAHVGFFILMKQGTRILCTSCNTSRSTIPSLPWLLSLQKPRRPLATGCAAAGLLIASSSSSSSSIRISGQP